MGTEDNPRGLESVFPSPITMDAIRNMNRRELSAAEKSSPYSKYYHRELAEIPISDIELVNAGPVASSRATSIHDRNDLMKPGYLEVETGYAVMEDGSGFAATLVEMPDVTPAMLDWWFNWHPLEGLRYAIWCPTAHTDISVKDPARHLDRSGISLEERNYGCTHYPVEGFDLDGAMKISIEFFSPEKFGLDMRMFKEPGISRAYCANVNLFALDNLPLGVFFHAVREKGGGIEYRSRYWMGYTMAEGKPSSVDLPVSMVDLARNNCLHSLIEYNNLASFLPQLHQEMGGRIDDPDAFEFSS